MDIDDLHGLLHVRILRVDRDAAVQMVILLRRLHIVHVHGLLRQPRKGLLWHNLDHLDGFRLLRNKKVD